VAACTAVCRLCLNQCTVPSDSISVHQLMTSLHTNLDNETMDRIIHTFVPQPTSPPQTTVRSTWLNVAGALGHFVAASGIHSVKGRMLAAMPAKRASVDLVGVVVRSARSFPEAPRVVPVE